MTADGQIKSFFQRWENLEAEKKQTADALKDLFAEAKSFGYDTKALRAAFRLKVKEDLDNPADAEFEAVVDTYLNAINAPSVSTRDARLRTRENIEKFDPETGQIIEDINPRLAKQIVDGMQTEAGRAALIAAVDIMIEREEAEQEFQAKASDDNGATVQDIEDTADSVTGDASRSSRGDDSPASNPITDAAISRPGIATLGRPEIENRSGEEASVSNASGEMQDEDAIHLPTNSEIENPSPDAELSSAAANTGGDHVAGSSNHAASQAGALVKPAPAINHRFRPNCQHRDHCKSGTADHCHSCKRAAQESAS